MYYESRWWGGGGGGGGYTIACNAFSYVHVLINMYITNDHSTVNQLRLLPSARATCTWSGARSQAQYMEVPGPPPSQACQPMTREPSPDRPLSWMSWPATRYNDKYTHVSQSLWPDDQQYTHVSQSLWPDDQQYTHVSQSLWPDDQQYTYNTLNGRIELSRALVDSILHFAVPTCR